MILLVFYRAEFIPYKACKSKKNYKIKEKLKKKKIYNLVCLDVVKNNTIFI
jgi:hypothetical protein